MNVTDRGNTEFWNDTDKKILVESWQIRSHKWLPIFKFTKQIYYAYGSDIWNSDSTMNLNSAMIQFITSGGPW